MILEQHYPSKFLDEVERILNKVEVPERLVFLAEQGEKIVCPLNSMGLSNGCWIILHEYKPGVPRGTFEFEHFPLL